MKLKLFSSLASVAVASSILVFTPTSSDAVTMTAAQARVAKQHSVVSTAASKKGLPYRYGGTSPTRGFDCSGYTQWVYKKHGVKLPRTTRDQIKKGKAVSLRNAQPGDLIFTGSGGHVGIVAEKGGKTMWHSPRTGRTISKDPIKYYKVKKVVRVL